MTYEEFRTRYHYDTATDRLGGGGFGEVFKAYDTVRDRWVAIKIAKVLPELEAVRLKREVEMVSILSEHANVAYYEKCYTFPSFDGEYDFGILQYYEEGNLLQLLQRESLAMEQKQSLLRQILSGLEFLHGQGVIHRDLKPQNILIVKRGNEYIPKITDFGISKKLDINKSSVYSNSLVGAGTLAYSSPEQLGGRTIRKNTDLWSFGVIAFQLLTGEQPFTTGTHDATSEAGRLELFTQINSGKLPDTIQTVPEPWQSLIKACLVPNPEQRAQNCRACVEILEGDMDKTKMELTDPIPLPLVIPPISKPQSERINKKRFSPTLIAIGASLLAVLLAFVICYYLSIAVGVFFLVVSLALILYFTISFKRMEAKKRKHQQEQGHKKAMESCQEADERRSAKVWLQEETKETPLQSISDSIPSASLKKERTKQWLVLAGFVAAVAILWGLIDSNSRTPTPICPPQLSTPSVTSIGEKNAIVSSFITDKGNGTVTERGVCYSTVTLPTISSKSAYGNKVEAETEADRFTVNINELSAGKTYYVRSYAINEAGVAYSPQQSFKTDAVPIEMVYVEGGTFTMGCTSEQGGDCYDDEKPAHQVTLSSYRIGKYPVTQKQWGQVMGSNPSSFSGCDDCPVENVSWDDVQEFIRKLNAQTGKNYRLPTEAEWEFAARGGNKSRSYKYSGSNTLDNVAWYDGNSGSKTHPVGQKAANELGIYDMSGNVWEWCSDWYGAYSSILQTNPKGPSTGSTRVLRGGSWNYYAGYCRVSHRSNGTPDSCYGNSGFRLLLP